MEVGDYVRLKSGYIDRIEDLKLKTKYTKYNTLLFEHKVVECLFSDEDLKQLKSSPNIIELFEEHDLVVMEYFSLRYNERVTRLFEVDYKDKRFMTLKNSYADFMLENNEFNDNDKALHPIIKSIVTHEQFERIQYNLESEVN